MNILVLCTGNSARSILLEAILDGRGGARVSAWSAGSHPTGRVHPQARAVLRREGFDVAGLRSKSWDEFAGSGAPRMDAVITVCGSAAGETCPVWPGTPLRAHWGVEDPAAVPADQLEEAFETAFRLLSDRADRLLALDLDALDRAELSAALTRIGAA